jgi:hypothetical protein
MGAPIGHARRGHARGAAPWTLKLAVVSPLRGAGWPSGSAWVRQTGLPREGVVGRRASEIFPAEEVAFWVGAFARVAETGEAAHIERYVGAPGALSAPAGRVSVSWRLEGGPQGVLRLQWAEAGGPAVEGPPARRGFGSRVLDATVRRQLGGKV